MDTMTILHSSPGMVGTSYSLTHPQQRGNPSTSGRLQTRGFVKGKPGVVSGSLSPTSEGPRRLAKRPHWQRKRASPPHHVQKRVRHVQVGPATRSHALCLDIRVILPFVSCLTRQLGPTPTPARCPRPLLPSRFPRCPLPRPPLSLLYLPCSPLALAAGRKHIATAFVSLPHFPSARLLPGTTTRIRYHHNHPSLLHHARLLPRSILIPVSLCFSQYAIFLTSKTPRVMSPVFRFDPGSVPPGCRLPMHVDTMKRFFCSCGFGFDGPRNVVRER